LVVPDAPIVGLASELPVVEFNEIKGFVFLCGLRKTRINVGLVSTKVHSKHISPKVPLAVFTEDLNT
jgi:hypothetical protein